MNVNFSRRNNTYKKNSERDSSLSSKKKSEKNIDDLLKKIKNSYTYCNYSTRPSTDSDSILNCDSTLNTNNKIKGNCEDLTIFLAIQSSSKKETSKSDFLKILRQAVKLDECSQICEWDILEDEVENEYALQNHVKNEKSLILRVYAGGDLGNAYRHSVFIQDQTVYTVSHKGIEKMMIKEFTEKMRVALLPSGGLYDKNYPELTNPVYCICKNPFETLQTEEIASRLRAL